VEPLEERERRGCEEGKDMREMGRGWKEIVRECDEQRFTKFRYRKLLI